MNHNVLIQRIELKYEKLMDAAINGVSWSLVGDIRTAVGYYEELSDEVSAISSCALQPCYHLSLNLDLDIA